MQRIPVQERNLCIEAEIQGLSRTVVQEFRAAAIKVRTTDDLQAAVRNCGTSRAGDDEGISPYENGSCLSARCSLSQFSLTVPASRFVDDDARFRT